MNFNPNELCKAREICLRSSRGVLLPLKNMATIQDVAGVTKLWHIMLSPPSSQFRNMVDIVILSAGIVVYANGFVALIPHGFLIDPMLYQMPEEQTQEAIAQWICEVLQDIVDRPSLLKKESRKLGLLELESHHSKNVHVENGKIIWRPLN